MLALPRKPREALCLRYIECETYPAIGQALKCTPGKAKSLVRGAAKMLRKKCGKAVPPAFVKRAVEVDRKAKAKRQAAALEGQAPTARTALLETVSIGERFARVYPRLSELNERLGVVEALLGTK